MWPCSAQEGCQRPVSTVSAAIYHPKEFPHLAVVRDAGPSRDSIRNTALSLMNPQKWGARGNMPDWSQAAAGQWRHLISGILWQLNNGTETRRDSAGPKAKRIKEAPCPEMKAPQGLPERRSARSLPVSSLIGVHISADPGPDVCGGRQRPHGSHTAPTLQTPRTSLHAETKMSSWGAEKLGC